MNYSITTKGFTVSEELEQKIKNAIQKLEIRIQSFSKDAPILEVIIKKHEKHTFYTGQVSLKLAKKTLYAKSTGHHELVLIADALRTLIQEVEKYKSLHIKSNSMHPDRRSLKDVSA